MIVEITINFIFLFEMVLDITLVKKPYSNRFRLWPETLCQLINIFAVIKFCQNITNYTVYNSISKLFELIIFIRVTKLLTLMYEIRVLRLIIETMRNLASPIKNLVVVTVAIFYLFSVFGCYFFGGKVTVNSP